MSSRAYDRDVSSISFISREIQEAVHELDNWLVSNAISPNYMNSFYFLDMVVGYDGEIGYTITVYHGKETV